MQHRQTSRRRRPSSNPRSMGQVAGNQSSGRLDVRVRGNAHQLLEKYKQMARDSQQAGDRVASEFYLQHADHYFRVLNDNRIRQEEQRARRNGSAQRDSDNESGGRPEDTEAAEAEERPRRRASGRRGERSRDNPRDGERGRSRRNEATDENTEVLKLDMSDGEAALAAFGGAPEAAAAGQSGADEPEQEAEAAEAKPRRRTRTRKTTEAAADES